MHALPNRDQFEAALGVLGEERYKPGLRKTEDARAEIAAVASYYWRQLSFNTILLLVGVSIATGFLPAWPTMGSAFVGAGAGGVVALVLQHFTVLGRLLAPPGFSPADVRRAVLCLNQPT